MNTLTLIAARNSAKPDLVEFANSCGYHQLIFATVPDVFIAARESKSEIPISIIGSTAFRERAIRALSESGAPIKLVSLIHPTAIVSPFASIGEGCIIGRHVIINPSAVLDQCVTIGDGTVVEHDDRIMALATLGPDCALGGNVIVGYASTLHRDVTINQRTYIGRRCVAGACTAVISCVPDDCFVFGIPGRVQTRRASDAGAAAGLDIERSYTNDL